ncbi:MAG: carbohydrate-binding family 6 protein [Tepidisphaerales bacterium]
MRFIGLATFVVMILAGASSGRIVVGVEYGDASQAMPVRDPAAILRRTIEDFAAKEIQAAVKAGGDECHLFPVEQSWRTKTDLTIRLFVNGEGFAPAVPAGRAAKLDGPQAYSIRRIGTDELPVIAVIGQDGAGVLYGALDVAEAARMGRLQQIGDSDGKPFIARRGIKFNIPLDARTPSYSDGGDSAQANIPEMWSEAFWTEFLDEMARDRFNVLSLWNLHPFPSMVKVAEYPEVALADVKRTTLKFDTTFKLTGVDMWRQPMAGHLETVRQMSIEEKIAFWRKIMAHAHARGIEVYVMTWNIFTFGTDGKYGITPAQDNPATVDYFRKSVRDLILTYPDLDGIGVTAGENMQERKDEFAKEKWLWNTYGLGVIDAKKQQPARKVRFIHRFHQTGMKEVLDTWKDYPDTFDFSYKYSVAHMYSMVNPPFARGTLAELPADKRTWMTVRNDDIYSFRWGDPAFARAYVRNLPGADKLAGYYMGPDGYIWGREFISTEAEEPRQLVIKKQWYSFMLWGRLSYNPDLPDTVFRDVLARRYPEANAAALYEASCRASRIIPQITRFYWQDIDLKWFPEACISHPSYHGFHTVKHFVEGRPMPESGIYSITQWADLAARGEAMRQMTPLQVADELAGHAAATRAGVEQMGPPKDKELRLLLGDVSAMAYLGDYYAEKIRGACELGLLGKDGKAVHRDAAIVHLETAVAHWKKYAKTATAQYRPQFLTRIGLVDLNALTEKVKEDVEIARTWK